MSADKDNSFITEHFALVHSIAGRFRNRGIEYDELFSAVSYTHLTLPTILLV